MTNKQQLFVDEYLIDLNATQAAIRAGYSQKTAQEIGSENLSKPIIAKAVGKAFRARSHRTEITQDMVMQELVAIAYSWEVKVSDRLVALRELGKHLGVSEHIRHSGEITTNVRQMSDEELLERSGQFANRLAALSANGTNGDGA